MRLNQCFPNVFAYCDNNPVNNCDPSGHFAFAIPVIAFVAVVAVVAAVVIAAAYYSSTPAGQRSLGGLYQAYSQHIQNCIKVINSAASTIGNAAKVMGATRAAVFQSVTQSKAKEKSKTADVAPTKPKRPIIFPANPADFHPKGLTEMSHPGTYNGSIVQWVETVKSIVTCTTATGFRNLHHLELQ